MWRSFAVLVVFLSSLSRLSSQGPDISSARGQSETDRLSHKILAEMIAIDTTHESGDTTPAAELLAQYLREVGFTSEDVQVIGPKEKNKNLVARLRAGDTAAGLKPILFFAHLDVVAAGPRENWHSDPFTLTERDGVFYGRGVMDVKLESADLVANLIRLKREGYQPSRDIIIALTAGEESGADYSGIEWLVQEHRALIEPEYAINLDCDAGQKKNGKRQIFGYNLDEKTSRIFSLEAHSPGGHTSIPTRDNSIARLSGAVSRIFAYEFPVHLSPSARRYLREMAKNETPPLAADMRRLASAREDKLDPALLHRVTRARASYNAQLRTTCTPTLIQGGSAINALPQEAIAKVKCNILPQDSVPQVEATLKNLVNDPKVAVVVRSSATNKIVPVTELPQRPVPQPALPELLARAVEKVSGEMYPGIPVTPVLLTGASDSVVLRRAGIPSYGISGVFFDSEDEDNIHGPDERLGVEDFYNDVEFTYRMMRTLTAPTARVK